MIPVSVSVRVSNSRWPAPWAATTSLWYRTAMLRAVVIRAIRYDDMVFGQRAGAYHEHNLLGESGQLQCSLAGRIRRTDDVDNVTLTLVRLADRGAVVDPTAGELGQARVPQGAGRTLRSPR